MADDNLPDGGAKPDGGTGTPKTFTQDELNKIVSTRVNEVKQKFANYDDLVKTVETLTEEKKKREEAELSEIDKLKKQSAELLAQIENLSGYKTKWENHEKSLEESLNSQMDEHKFTDDEKKTVMELPLSARKLVVEKLIEASTAGSEKKKLPGQKGGGAGDKAPITQKEMDDAFKQLRAKF